MNFLNRIIIFEPSDWIGSFVLISFLPFTAIVLAIDSRQLVTSQGLDGQPLANVVIISYFVLLLFGLRPEQRLMALIFVPFSAIGECIFSLLFGLYIYRLEMVPLYVPFGHGILFSMGLLTAELSLIRQHEEQLKPVFITLFGLLFGGAILFLHDSLSVIFGLVFLWVLRRKSYKTFYFIMGLLVLYVELTGTYWGCWAWTSHPFGQSWLHATNPPVGAFACYLLADLGVMKIARYWQPLLGLETDILLPATSD
ncbi:MAG: hypothetical protein SAJ12_17935 [Jaaginema sp. PMC 1079.18]|nr:hypothetical protein [Jaaginema sp. PMC 1080.18]MEC4852864.1 hypothetical protein [Jaaginema sp. PMC 1079.18]MEC4868612.1 hypothetical protein [Jaaginema sp. PMC 1078.18]